MLLNFTYSITIKPSILCRLLHMVVTRSQTNRNNSLEQGTMSENEIDLTCPTYPRDQVIEFDEGNLLNRNRNNNVDHNNIERRFSEMSRQISELTNIVLSLTERLFSNNREGNGLNTLIFDPNGRPDTDFSKKNSGLFGDTVYFIFRLLQKVF